MPDGPPLAGWTAYAPLSAVGKDSGPGEGLGQTLWGLSIFVFCIASLLGSLNFIATTLDLRTKGMTLARMPIVCWAWFITSCIALLAFAVLLPACLLLILDRVAGTSFFIPSGLNISDHLQPHQGGSPLLWQHLFWFFGHPEVYIAILPAIGIVSHILINSMRKPMLSHKALIYCMMGIGFLSYMVWGHHMFLSGMNPFSALVFSFPTLMITIPATIMTLIWLGSLYGSNLRINAASLFCLGFISMFVSGGVSGFFLAQPSIDIYLHATYFVVGHFHMVMGVAAIFGVFAGTYFWFPKMTGRMMSETIGPAALLAHVHRDILHLHAVSLPGTGGQCASLLGVYRRFPGTADAGAQVHHLCCFVHGGGAADLHIQPDLQPLRREQMAPENPWEATSLEWSTPSSPPPFDNFGGVHPVVYHDPYQYGVQSSTGDYLMQASPERAGETP